MESIATIETRQSGPLNLRLDVLRDHFWVLIVTALFGLSLCSAWPEFDRRYDLPQMFSFWLLSLCLWFRRAIAEFKGVEWAMSVAVTILAAYASARLEIVHDSVLLIGLVAVTSYLFSRISAVESQAIRTTVVVIALVQTCLLVWATFIEHSDEIGLRKLNGVPVGTVGNPDFLATVIAAAIYFNWEQGRDKRLKTLITVLLLVGLVLTRSRGTIGLVLLTMIWAHTPKWALGTLIATAALAVILHWDRFAGRIQLWYISFAAFLDSPFVGHGVGSFDSVYFNKNLEIMSRDESFRSLFGPWSSQVTDAHNLILHWAVEYGSLGAIAATSLVLFVLVRLRFNQASDRMLARLIILKSLYTVVLISIQSIVLFAFAIGHRRHASHEPQRTGLCQMLMALFLIVAVTQTLRVSMSTSLDLRAGLRILQFGIPELSLQRTDDILRRNPNNTDALLAKSYAYLRMRQCSHSSYFAIRAAHLKQNMDVYKRAGHILFECRFYQESLDLFDRLHIVFPEHRTTTMKIAWANFFLGNFEVAQKMAQNVIEIKPRRVSHSDQRNLSEARDLLKRIAQISAK